MRVLVQWARASGSGWEEVQSNRWRQTPKRHDPTGAGLAVDDAPGWVSAVNIQGVTMSGADHYAVEHVDDETARVTVWCDDPADYDPGWRYGMVWTFRTLCPDTRGNYNTAQAVVYYAEQDMAARLVYGGLDSADIRPYADLPAPPPASVRHGKGMSDQAHGQHRARRTPHGWREWTEGVPPGLIENGKLKRGARG